MLLIVVLLNGCGSTSERSQTRIANALPPSVLGYKVGKPYQVKGVWYYPQVDYGYSEDGIASWYGPGFHGRSTANGEEYDMNDLTAAHRTLPMPSIVQVTNLENGRSIKLRVNDRGPFVGNRIIDVSRRAAQLLGFHMSGMALVRVEIVADESKQLAAALGVPVDVAAAEHRTEQPVVEVASAYSSPEPSESPPQPQPELQPQPEPEPNVGQFAMTYTSDAPPQTPTESYPEAHPFLPAIDSMPEQASTEQARNGSAMYVQAGAFADAGRADLARRRLSPIGPIVMSTSRVNGRDLLRVRVGPLHSGEAERVLASVSRAGFPDCRLVAE